MNASSTIDGDTPGIIRETLGGRQFSSQSQRIFVTYHKNNENNRYQLIENLLSATTEIDCVVSYTDIPDKDINETTVYKELQGTHLLVLFVTKELLDVIANKKSLELAIAKELKIPILPIAKYRELFSAAHFKKAMGTTHGIALNDPEYPNNLKAQLESLLVPSELVDEICSKAFSAKLFLGYLRKDLETALIFMKKFHDMPCFEAISIWYDRFLIGGVDYKKEIKRAIVNSDLFTLLVTPNLVAYEKSYVRTKEYPFAKSIRKPVLSIEAISTDPIRFAEYFSGEDIDVKLGDIAALYDKFKSKIDDHVYERICRWELNSKRAYLLGKAYLHGIRVEKDFDRAIKLLEKATDDLLDTDISYSKSAISAANQLADIYADGREIEINYVKALMWRKKAGTFCEKVFGVEHQETATAYNNIAIVYQDQGEYTKALEWYTKVLAIREKVLNSEHPDIATTYNNMALAYQEIGKYAVALEQFRKALEINEKVLGVEHPDIATTYNNIAIIYYKQGEYAEALNWYKKALEINEKVLGVEHPNTAICYNNFAVVYKKQGKYTDALYWYKKALATYEKVLGVEHPNTATAYDNIAGIYRNQCKYKVALELCKKALATYEKVLGVEHPNTATAYDNIAGIHHDQGDYEKALDWYKEALIVREKALGTEHPDTATTYNNIATVYRKQGKYTEALYEYNKALVIFESTLGKKHPLTATAYHNIATVYNNLGRQKESLELFKTALVIREKVLGKEHHDTAATYNNIANVYDKQGKYGDALKWYLKSYRTLILLDEAHPHTALVRNSIKRLYISSELNEPFENWLKKNI